MELQYRTVAFDAISGAGKSLLISKVFGDLKLKGADISIIPDITRYTQIQTPFNNLFDGGGFEKFSYYYLFLDREMVSSILWLQLM